MNIKLSPKKSVKFDFMFTEAPKHLDTASTIHIQDDKLGGRYVAVDEKIKETQRLIWRSKGHACHTVSYNPLLGQLMEKFLDKLAIG